MADHQQLSLTFFNYSGTDAAESDVEDGPESHVEVTKKTKKGQRVQQSAIKLQELGPRIKMQLVKIEDGVCDGAVLHHAIVKKSAEEVEALKARKDEEKKLKEERRREQEARVLAKGGKIKVNNIDNIIILNL